MARHVRLAAEQLEAVRARLPDHSEHDGALEQPVPRGDGVVAEQAVLAAQQAEQCRSRCAEATRAIGSCFHPVRLEDGQLRTLEDRQVELTRRFDHIEIVAIRVELGETSLARIAKARRQIGSLIATLSSFSSGCASFWLDSSSAVTARSSCVAPCCLDST
ncbi:MAG: hypothetical protein HYV63_20900 [Candidatus Schekmanbacteria bacterium]|nr:hypothetical protein [Candidatus Schekmanbacteria bacterium]